MSKSTVEHSTGDPVLMRRARLAKIHLAKKSLAMEEESYRALLRRITGKDSSAAMEIAELDLVLGEFKRLGFAEKARIRPRKPAPHPHQRKVYALWGALQPYLKDSSARALRSFCKRQTGIEAPEFLSPEDANKVTEGLKAWLKRAKAQASA
jgi:phage gp16-like protein